MQLSHEQKRQIFDNGFVVVPGVVPQVMVNAALKAINNSIGEGMDPARMDTFRAQSFCPEIITSPQIKGLVTHTPAYGLAESVIGEGKVNPVTGGQIALRFPILQDPPGAPGPHIDGFYTPTNGVPEGTVLNFTALVAIFLSDLPTGNAGNFTVWPGAHKMYETYFRQNGPQSLAQGMPKGVELPEPLHVTGRAGDMVIAHYLLPHGIAPNVSPHIRYACFYRLKHVEHEDNKWETMTDMWLHWPGIRDAFAKT